MSDSSDSGREGSSAGVFKKKKYAQFYKQEWEKIPDFQGWLSKSKKGGNYAKCKCCDKDIIITSGKNALFKHSISVVHKTKVKSLLRQPTLTSFTAAGSTKAILEKDIKKGTY